MKRVLLLTGSPGIGKTTVMTRAVERLIEKGFRVGGMISQEVRKNGVRIGFEIIDLTDRRRGWLARADQKSGPRVGRYVVDLKDLEAIGAESITKAVENCDIVTIDEVGPMELSSRKFREATKIALQSQKLVLAVVHWKTSDKLVAEAKARFDSETFLVTYDNREKIVEILVLKTLEYLEQI